MTDIGIVRFRTASFLWALKAGVIYFLCVLTLLYIHR